MSYRPFTRPWHSRAVALVISAAIAVAVVALPWFGIACVEKEARVGKTVTAYLSQLDDAARALSGTGMYLRQYETDPAPETLQRLRISRVEAEAAVDGIDADVRDRQLGFAAPEATLVRAYRAYLDAIAARESWVVSGRPAEDYPGTQAFIRVRGESLDAQTAINATVTARTVAANAAEEQAIDNARWLTVLSAVVAIVGFGGFAWWEIRAGKAHVAATEARAQYLERVAESRADLVNLASHELRNPLTVMTLTAQTMQRSAARRADEQLESLAAAGVTAARRAEALVAELLDLSRLDANRLDLTLQTVPVRPAIEDALRLTLETRGERPVHVGGDAGVHVKADAGRFAIIVRNMVDNAFKYSPAGSVVRVTSSIMSTRVVIAVEDEGPGVRAGDIERIFSRFERLDRTRHIGGIGIGLHLSRELARRMGGDLVARSGEESGGRFELWLPLAPASPDVRDNEAAHHIPAQGTVPA